MRYMVNFQFNDEQSKISRRIQPAKTKGIQGYLIKWGIAKSEPQASLIMIALVVVCFAIIIYQQADLFRSAPVEIVDPSLAP